LIYKGGYDAGIVLQFSTVSEGEVKEKKKETGAKKNYTAYHAW